MTGPIRLTRRRAEALMAAARHGIDEWEADIQHVLDHFPHDLDALREAKTTDLDRAAALDALAIMQHRYLGATEPLSAEPTLF